MKSVKTKDNISNVSVKVPHVYHSITPALLSKNCVSYNNTKIRKRIEYIKYSDKYFCIFFGRGDRARTYTY